MTKPFQAHIYCGLRVGYSDEYYTHEDVEKICQSYVNEFKWCVTITKTRYVYVDGAEDGIIVGIIYYPRFPKTDEALKRLTLRLASILLEELGQNRISVVFNNEVVMLGGQDDQK